MTALASISHNLLLLTLFLTLLGCGFVSYQALYKKSFESNLVGHVNIVISIIYIFVSLVLLYAFYSYEFSYKYVHDYSDSTLPIFYRLTAFWGGQAGSLLFWALSVVLCGIFFQYTENYKKLSKETRAWYLFFYYISLAFFSLLLTTDNDPFIILNPAPLEGRGLIPLLQHPGMIFHPPLLLLGYGGFTIPACLALAQIISRPNNPTEISWHKSTLNLMLLAWLVLSAGIILGAWWAYMELGWGGYWAWDPVENASLIPWFFATAAIHLGLLSAYRNKGQRLHTLLMGLTYVSAFFATWLVRGNVVASVHAFGGGVGGTIGLYVLFTFFAVLCLCLMMPQQKKNSFGGPESKEGLALGTSLLLVTISIIIMLATLWPVISVLPNTLFNVGGSASVGLNAGFYNTTIMPLMTVLLAMLTICPWISWSGKIVHKLYFGIVGLVFAISMFISWTFFDIHKAIALIGASVSMACMISWVLYLYHSNYSKISACLVHIGFAMMGLGVAISGPYQIEQEIALKRGETMKVDDFNIQLNELYHVPAFNNAVLIVSKDGKADTIPLRHNVPIKISGYTLSIQSMIDNRQMDFGRDVDLLVQTPENNSSVIPLKLATPRTIGDFTVEVQALNRNRISFIEVELFVYKNNQLVGSLLPQIRTYSTHLDQRFSEAVTIFSLGKEIYATFSGLDQEERARVRILIQPMVNWIWIGGLIMSIAPFFSIFALRSRNKEEDE